MNTDIVLALVDAGLSRPHATLQCLADDLTDALAAYEHYCGDGSRREHHRAVRAVMFADGGFSELGNLPESTRLYALSCTDEPDVGNAVEVLEQLGRHCVEHGITWSGGVAIPEGRLVVPCANGPRMGRMRRSRSETIDRLILAMRCDCSISDLQANDQALSERNPRTRKPHHPNGNILAARSPAPAFLYNRIVTLVARLTDEHA